jgi:hypothetical protein
MVWGLEVLPLLQTSTRYLLNEVTPICLLPRCTAERRVELRCFRLLMSENGLYCNQGSALVNKDSCKGMPHFMWANLIFQFASVGYPLENGFRLESGHSDLGYMRL